MVAAHQVHLGEDPHALQAAVEVLDMRQGVSVIHSGVVEASEITTRSPATTGLWDDVKR